MKKKRLRLILIVIIAVIVVAAVVIGSLFLLNRSALTKNISVSKVPSWSKTVGKVAGWNVVAAPSTSNTYQKTTGTTVINFVQNGAATSATGKYCSALAQTVFLPSYQQHEGDLYLSKASAYAQAQNTGATLKSESTTWLNSSKGSVQFVTGAYAGNVQTGTVNATPTSILTAVRAIDTVYPNGATKANSPNLTGLYGADPYKGVPVLTVTYTCYNKTASVTEFASLLKALTANL